MGNLVRYIVMKPGSARSKEKPHTSSNPASSSGESDANLDLRRSALAEPKSNSYDNVPPLCSAKGPFHRKRLSLLLLSKSLLATSWRSLVMISIPTPSM
jgi:hypothetical protein